MSVWRGPGGIEVQVITLDRGRGPRQMYRVICRGVYRDVVVCDTRRIREIRQWVRLEDLVEVIDLPVGRSSAL
ncbi:MAG TPA: hypothetical protein VM347_23310 [Nonomuraea sp.]|nr:hypothetical protein [Nonomuraea sp.]